MRWYFLLVLIGLSVGLTNSRADRSPPSAPMPSIGQPSDSLPESPFASGKSTGETSAVSQPIRLTGIQKMLADWRDLESRGSIPLDGPRFWLIQQWDRLAWDAGQGAMAFNSPSEQLAARELAIHSLARSGLLLARLGDEQAVQVRLAQIKLATSVLAETKLPASGEIAHRWQRWFEFQQELRGKTGLDARSAAALGWLSKMADNAHPAEQIALLALADHVGQSGMLLEQCRRIQADGDKVDPSVRRFIEQRLAHRYLLGRRFSADLRLADHRRWLIGQSGKQVGKDATVVGGGGGVGVEVGGEIGGGWRLIHFYADWHRPSMDQAAAIARYRQEIGTDRLSVLSVALWPDPLSSTMTSSVLPPKADWPVYQESSSQVALSKLFYVTQLPRLVLIDPQGRIVCISSSLSPLAPWLAGSSPIAPTPLPPPSPASSSF